MKGRSGSGWIQVVLIFAFIMSVPVAAAAQSYDDWLRQAQLGPYQPEVEDWDAIYEAAKNEPPLLVYSVTSRINDSAADLIERYPGLAIESVIMDSSEAVERLRREWDAGRRDMGMLFVGRPELQGDVLLPRRAVTRYVPRELEAVMRREDTHPLLKQRASLALWWYSTDIENPETPPWTNLWEFTTEKWRGRVMTVDPLDEHQTFEYFVALVAKSDEVAALYEEYFGEPIQLTTENAGLEYIKRLLDNGLRLASGSRDLAEAVTHARGHFAALGPYSRYRDVLEGTYDFAVDTEILPAVLSFHWVSIGSFTQSPNTAKMLIRWIMSQEGGEPWWGPNFPVNPEIVLPEPWYLTLADFPNVWDIDLTLRSELADMVLDYWLLWR